MPQKSLSVTTIIPSSGRRATLHTSIQSALEQSSEVIVVLNGNDIDNSIVSKISDNPKIKIIRIPENIGVGPARQAGINAAVHDYITFLDDDDFFLPDRNSKMLHIFKSENIDLVMCDSIWVIHDRCKILPGRKIKTKNLVTFMLSFSPLHGSGLFSPSTLMISKEYLKKLPWSRDLNVTIEDLHEDMQWAIQSQKLGIKWARIQEIGTVVIRNTEYSLSDKFRESGRYEKENAWLTLNSSTMSKDQRIKFKLHHILPVKPRIELDDIFSIIRYPWSGILGIRRRYK